MSTLTRTGPEPIGSSQPTPTTGLCVRCREPLPADRKHARAHASCVTKLPASGSGPLPRAPRTPYGRFPTTPKGYQRIKETK
jgi:hypothetical protein